MKIADIRKKNTDELTTLITELTAGLRDWRFGMSGGQKKNIRHARAIRRDIARIKTVRNEAKK